MDEPPRRSVLLRYALFPELLRGMAGEGQVTVGCAAEGFGGMDGATDASKPCLRFVSFVRQVKSVAQMRQGSAYS